jgi:hypothetical protein
MSGKEAAAALAQRWALRDVAPADLREMAERGLIRITCPGHCPLYDVEGFTAVDELRRAGDARRRWWAVSIDRWDAAEMLALSVEDFDALAAARDLQPGRFGRYGRSEVEAQRPDPSPANVRRLPAAAMDDEGRA